MANLVYRVVPDQKGWRVTVNSSWLGCFKTRMAAFRVAADEARLCNAAGYCSWVNVQDDSRTQTPHAAEYTRA